MGEGMRKEQWVLAPLAVHTYVIIVAELHELHAHLVAWESGAVEPLARRHEHGLGVLGPGT